MTCGFNCTVQRALQDKHGAFRVWLLSTTRDHSDRRKRVCRQVSLVALGALLLFVPTQCAVALPGVTLSHNVTLCQAQYKGEMKHVMGC